LKNLQELYLSGLPIRKLPKEIGKLENLKILALVETSISDFPKEFKNLKNLEILNLRNTSITNLPDEIKDKADNAQAIINYYFENVYQVKESDVRPLKEVKVLLVGQGRVGKTSLVRYLVDNKPCNPEEPSTHGIHRNKLKINVIEEKTNQPQDVQLNIWDFGGQDIQHQTHQFFLNQRSLYLLVLDAGRDEAGNKLDYWLKKIETVGKDAPILFAINKSERSLLPLDFTELKKNFNIKGFFNISCETGREIEELRQAIKSEIGKIENVFEPIRKEWFEVKEHLENLKEDYISRDEYRKICREKGVTETLSQDTLLILLHELGIMLNFKEHETEVLNPEWVTRGVYQVVTSLDVQTNNGILTPELLDAEITKLKEQLILEKKEYLRYPFEKYSFITDLMKKFELAYQIDDTDNYFVPSLLPKDSPYVGDWNEKECLGFRFNYENGLLHETIMSRFIVRMNRYILDKTQWLTGVLLQNQNGNKAVVKADLSNGYLTILINGNQNTRREFLGIIRDKFRDIHKDNRPIEEVPLKENPNVFVPYDHLVELESRSREKGDITVDKVFYEFDVKELLNGVSTLTEREAGRRNQEAKYSENIYSDKLKEEKPENQHEKEKTIIKTKEELEDFVKLQKLEANKELLYDQAKKSAKRLVRLMFGLSTFIRYFFFLSLIYLIFAFFRKGFGDAEVWTFVVFVGLEIINELLKYYCFYKTDKEFSWENLRKYFTEAKANKLFLKNGIDESEIAELRKRMKTFQR